MSLWMLPKESEQAVDPDELPDDWELERGWSDLHKAIELWNFLGDPKGRQLRDIAKNELPMTDPDARRIISIEQIRRILALLDGLEPAVRSATAEDYHLKPNDVERAQRHWKIVDHWKDDRGNEVHTIGNALGEARELEQFLRRALAEGRSVLID